MTPEERVNKYYCWVLDRLKEEFLVTLKGKPVPYRLSHVAAAGVPNNETEVEILLKLEEEGALKVRDNPFEFPVGSENLYYVDIFQPKFNEIYRTYESGSSYQENKKEEIDVTPKNQSVIKSKTLELISLDIGDLDTGTNLINFLTDCGVNNKLIEYPQTKWRMIYSVLIALATSPNPKDQETLFKIIEEASHPLMYNGNEELAKKNEDKFNRLLGYDGFALRNYKLKKINKEAEQDNDLDLYLKKKILVESWRDDLPHPISELSFNNNTVEQICYSLWDLFVSEIIFFGANTFPEDILVETDPRFHQEIAFNWNLVRDLDNNPHKVESSYGFEIEVLNRKRLKKDVDEEINEFISNKVNKEKIEGVKDFYPDTKFLETPSYLRGISYNYYAYKKQKETLLHFIADLYEKFENEILVIRFSEITDKNLNVLRTLLALEAEGFFNIKELKNDKKEWMDKDGVYTKIQLTKSKIPIIKKSISITGKQNQEKGGEIGDELLTNPHKREPIPIWGEIKIEGLKEGFETLARVKKEDKNKFPYKLPAGTIWGNIIIKFLNDEDVFIQVKQLKHNTNYEEMGFVGKGNNPNPSEAWTFLRVLAHQVNGELTIKDAEAKDRYKKQKELLGKALQKYFLLDYDPFYPYHSSSEKSGDSYKIKLTLIPPDDPSKQNQLESNSDQ